MVEENTSGVVYALLNLVFSSSYASSGLADNIHTSSYCSFRSETYIGSMPRVLMLSRYSTNNAIIDQIHDIIRLESRAPVRAKDIGIDANLLATLPASAEQCP